MSNYTRMRLDERCYTVDVKKCRQCRYCGTYCCEYIIYTGKKREHDGRECFSFEEQDSGKRRRSKSIKRKFIAKREPVKTAAISYEDYVMMIQHMGAS